MPAGRSPRPCRRRTSRSSTVRRLRRMRRSATVDLPSDGTARLTTRAAGPATVFVVAPLDDVAESSAALIRALAFGVPLSAAVLAVLVWWAVGRSLRPVESIRAQVDRITGEPPRGAGAGADHRRGDHPAGADDERDARPACSARPRSSAGSSADASHELRSPLARMRAELEVDAAHPGSADPSATASSVLAEVTALQRLVEDLLLLARGDAGRAGPGRAGRPRRRRRPRRPGAGGSAGRRPGRAAGTGGRRSRAARTGHPEPARQRRPARRGGGRHHPRRAAGRCRGADRRRRRAGHPAW